MVSEEEEEEADKRFLSLNPCFSGGWSRRGAHVYTCDYTDSLNPCFSGGWSRRGSNLQRWIAEALVLILVLVEDGLGAPQRNRIKAL